MAPNIFYQLAQLPPLDPQYDLDRQIVEYLLVRRRQIDPLVACLDGDPSLINNLDLDTVRHYIRLVEGQYYGREPDTDRASFYVRRSALLCQLRWASRPSRFVR